MDLIALVKWIATTDTKELVKVLEGEYSEYSTGNFSFFKEKVSVKQVKPTVPPNVPKNYGKTFYPHYKETAKKFLEERGGSYRGLTAETFEKYGIVVHPEFGVGEEKKEETLIIPYDDYHFVARAIDSKHRPTQHGQGAGLYEPMEINGEFPTFIVEGEIDALSVVQTVGHLGIRCVATGGANKYGKVVVGTGKAIWKMGEQANVLGDV